MEHQAPPLPLQPGDKLDHYRIDSIVSENDVAVLYRATDLSRGCTVAVKLLHPEIEADETFFDRFHREEEIGRTLNHPGLMKVIPENHHSREYIVMEWAEGKLLRQVLDEGHLSHDRAIAIAIGISQVLAYIHNHGITHRDLRPDHVLVGQNDQIKLLDFGLAGQTGAKRITFTNMSQVLHSPDYISPEQTKGKRGDARSDIYSLGVILYEMLTGGKPFTGRNAFEIMNDRLLHSPVPPREIDPSISPQLQEVVYRALEREPQYRYATAHDFAFDLEHLDHVGVAERPELWDWKRRRAKTTRKVLLYTAIILAPLLIFGLLLVFARH